MNDAAISFKIYIKFIYAYMIIFMSNFIVFLWLIVKKWYLVILITNHHWIIRKISNLAAQMILLLVGVEGEMVNVDDVILLLLLGGAVMRKAYRKI